MLPSSRSEIEQLIHQADECVNDCKPARPLPNPTPSTEWMNAYKSSHWTVTVCPNSSHPYALLRYHLDTPEWYRLYRGAVGQPFLPLHIHVAQGIIVHL